MSTVKSGDQQQSILQAQLENPQSLIGSHRRKWWANLITDIETWKYFCTLQFTYKSKGPW